MYDYNLYYEIDGVPEERDFESRGDKTAIKMAQSMIDNAWVRGDVSNGRLSRIVEEW